MSSIMDGVNAINSLTAQIDKLKSSSQQSPPDPKELEASIEQNFNEMLSNLLTTSDDEKENKNSTDIFSAFLQNSSNSWLNNLQTTGQTSSSTGQNTIDSTTASAVQALQNNPLALQAYLFNAQAGLNNL